MTPLPATLDGLTSGEIMAAVVDHGIIAVVRRLEEARHETGEVVFPVPADTGTVPFPLCARQTSWP